MPLTDSDPRVFFAAERTLLAWIRTGIAIMAVGFVVSRFGLFVQLIGLQIGKSSAELLNEASAHAADHAMLSSTLGILFVAAGSLLSVVATVQHRRFVSTLSNIDLPPSYSTSFAVLASLAVALLGIILAGYLAFTHP